MNNLSTEAAAIVSVAHSLSKSLGEFAEEAWKNLKQNK